MSLMERYRRELVEIQEIEMYRGIVARIDRKLAQGPDPRRSDLEFCRKDLARVYELAVMARDICACLQQGRIKIDHEQMRGHGEVSLRSISLEQMCVDLETLAVEHSPASLHDLLPPALRFTARYQLLNGLMSDA